MQVRQSKQTLHYQVTLEDYSDEVQFDVDDRSEMNFFQVAVNIQYDDQKK